MHLKNHKTGRLGEIAMSRLMSVCMIFVLIFALAGCAKQVPQFNASYYPECYDPIDKLCKDQSYAREAGGAVTGALVGALAGALIGGLSSGDWRGAAIGAGAGAVAGGVGGFFYGRLSKIQDQDKRLAEYQNILGEEAGKWDIERASVERAYKCYRDQIALLQRGWKEKRITREEFLARTREIKSGIEHINTYWAEAKNRMSSTVADGEKFIEDEERKAQVVAMNRRRQAAAAVNRARTASRRKMNAIADGAKQTDEQQALAMASLNELVTVSNSVAQYGRDFIALLSHPVSGVQI